MPSCSQGLGEQVRGSGCGCPVAGNGEWKPGPSRPFGHWRFPVEMGEHDLVGEQRGPFKGGGSVGIGAADQFILSVRELDKFGLTELADQAVAVALNQVNFQFHTPSL